MPASAKGPESTIGGRIAQARFQMAARLGRNVTQAWLAEQAGVSGPTVSQWESGVTEPSLTSVARIAKALGVSPGWIAWGEEPAATALDGLGLARDRERSVEEALEELSEKPARQRVVGDTRRGKLK